MRTMKPVAKIGVIRFRIGTEAIPAMTSPDNKQVSRFARPSSSPRPAEVPHRRELEIFATEQIAVAEIEGDQVDAGDQVEEERDEAHQQNDEEEPQRHAD